MSRSAIHHGLGMDCVKNHIQFQFQRFYRIINKYLSSSLAKQRFIWLRKIIIMKRVRCCFERVLPKTLEQKLKGNSQINTEIREETNQISFHFRTPLHLAVCNGHEAIVKLLLEQKCDVNARDMVNCLSTSNNSSRLTNHFTDFFLKKLKQTPLHWAVDEDHPNLVKLLLKYGADPHAESKAGETPLTIALQLRFNDLWRMMSTYKHQTIVSMEEQQEATDSLMQEMEKDSLSSFKHSDVDINQDSTSCDTSSSAPIIAQSKLNSSNHQQPQSCK